MGSAGDEDADAAIAALEDDIHQWDVEEAPYNGMHPEPVREITVALVYVGSPRARSEREPSALVVQDVRLFEHTLYPKVGTLKSPVLLSMIRNNSKNADKQYRPFRIMQYNMTADVEAAKRVDEGAGLANGVAAPYIRVVDGYPDVHFADTMRDLGGAANILYVFMNEVPVVKRARATRGRRQPVEPRPTRRTG